MPRRRAEVIVDLGAHLTDAVQRSGCEQIELGALDVDLEQVHVIDAYVVHQRLVAC